MEQQELKKTWAKYFRNKDEDTKRKLVEYYFINHVIKIAEALSRKLKKRIAADELASDGVTGLYESIEWYDPNRGIKFETYSFSRIWGSMVDKIRSYDWVPRSVRIRKRDIEKARQDLEIKKGKKVSEKDILEKLGIDETEYNREVKKFNPTSVLSLDAFPLQDPNRDFGEHPVNNCLIQKRISTPDSKLIRHEFFSKLFGKNLSSLQSYVIYNHYYLGFSFREIAKELDISEAKISQAHKRGLERLKVRIKVNPKYFSDDILSIILNCNDNEII